MDIYGESKLIGEDLMELFHHNTGTETIVTRLFNVYGPHETNEHLIPAILSQVLEGSREIDLGNLSPKRDFIHVTDIASAIITLVDEFDGSFRTFNVGTGTEYSVREVVSKTSEALGEDIKIAKDETRVRDSDRPHLVADISRITQETTWQTEIDLVKGLRELIDHSNAIQK
jgi:UDP-glucose 4-epimerase